MATFDLTCGARFYHPPKRGGTWVSFASRRAGIVASGVTPKHVGPHDKPVEAPNAGITIVRHPFSWWRSVYRNRCGWWAKDRRDLAGKPLSYYPKIDECEAHTYPQFMQNILDAGIINAWWDARYDHPCITHVIHQENMVCDYLQVLKDIGQEHNPYDIWDVPRANTKHYQVSPEGECEFQLPSELRQRVIDALDNDLLHRFGYL